MASWLQQLRSQPQSTRQTVALAAAVMITLIIVLVWLLFLAPYAPEESSADADSDAVGVLTTFSRGVDRTADWLAGFFPATE